MPTVRTSLWVQLNKGTDKAQLKNSYEHNYRKKKLAQFFHQSGKGLPDTEDCHTIIGVHSRNVSRLTEESQEDWLNLLGLLLQNTIDHNRQGITSYLLKRLWSIREEITNTGENVEKNKAKTGHHWWGYKLARPLWKTVETFLKKLKWDIPHDPAVPLLGIHPSEMKTGFRRHTFTPSSLQHYSQ